MATFKQYLQNRWYRGMSQDRAVAYPYQFQYGRNVNVRNEKGGVMLASRPTEVVFGSGQGQENVNIIRMAQDEDGTFLCLDYNETLNKCYLKKGDFSGLSFPSTLTTVATLDTWGTALLENLPFGPFITRFRDGWFVVNADNTKIYNIFADGTTGPGVLGEWIIAQLAAQGTITYTTDMRTHAVYNYADTFFLVAVGGVLLRYQPLTSDISDLANWKIIRYFGTARTIVGLSQSGNYLKIYVTDGVKTECHFAQGTFDLEESGLVQTITYEGRLCEDCLVTNGDYDYALFKTNIGIRLLEISGYSYNVIRETERRKTKTSENQTGWTLEKIFDDKFSTFSSGGGDTGVFSASKLLYYNNVLYCNLLSDGIWTFTKESVGSHGWTWGGVVERGREVIGYCQQMCINNGILTTLYLSTDFNIGSKTMGGMDIIDINDYPDFFVDNGYIIGNIFDGGCGSLFKKNVSTTLVCGNNRPQSPYNGILGLTYRYDRANNSLLNPIVYSNPIKYIETPGIYDSIFITSVQESVGGVSPEDIPTDPKMFNKPRNTIEYIIELMVPMTYNSLTDDYEFHIQISPILYEHNLIYEDSMRKYR